MDIKYKMMQMYLGWLKWGCTDVTQTENIVLVWEEVRESSSALRVDRDTSCPFLKVLIWVSKYNIFGPYTQTPCALLGCEIESKIFISCLRASLTSNMKSQSIRCQKSAWDPSGSFPGMSDRQCEISQNLIMFGFWFPFWSLPPLVFKSSCGTVFVFCSLFCFSGLASI